MADVRAKFWVTEVTRGVGRDGAVQNEKVTLNAVYSNNPGDENNAFWTATPIGLLTMTINNPQAFGKFLPGQNYYLDFTQADVPEAAVA